MDSLKKQDFTRRISQANSTQLVVIIYDIALSYIEDAIAEKQKEDPDKTVFDTDIVRIQNCIAELQNSLNFDYEPAKELRALYGYILRRLGACSATRDLEILKEISDLIKPLRDAYDTISTENKNGPVMGNSQTVYAGLTYGREELMESLSTPVSRGYLA